MSSSHASPRAAAASSARQPATASVPAAEAGFSGISSAASAEYARIPFADTSVYKVPAALTDGQVLFLADILPTSFEVGVLNGHVKPGDTVAVIGAGPVGLAAVLTASLFTPSPIIVIDGDQTRLARAIECGASDAIELIGEAARERVLELTDGLGVDVAIEAVGIPETFELCTDIVRSGGHVANVGVHGKPATLHLERLWIKGVTITTGLVDTSSTPRLMALVSAGKLDPLVFATHRFPLERAEEAYDAFGAARELALSKSCSKAPSTSDWRWPAPAPAKKETSPEHERPRGRRCR